MGGVGIIGGAVGASVVGVTAASVVATVGGAATGAVGLSVGTAGTLAIGAGLITGGAAIGGGLLMTSACAVSDCCCGNREEHQHRARGYEAVAQDIPPDQEPAPSTQAAVSRALPTLPQTVVVVPADTLQNYAASSLEKINEGKQERPPSPPLSRSRFTLTNNFQPSSSSMQSVEIFTHNDLTEINEVLQWLEGWLKND